jgi:CheY-like chemotaxis protein
VTVAESGDVAMGLLENESAISLLFTDCNMPGDLDGPGLAMEVRRRLPGLPVLFTSGVRGRVESVGNDTQSVAFISKPYTSSELNSAISELLGATLC